ncbi:MAG: TSUP family transporter [Christensenellaceae bacterium]|nr:TSUP family transporter [Christensenellaceae bacterium]
MKKTKTRIILGAGGLISGLLNGLLGTGGGILAIPAFRMAGEQQRHAQANASVFMLFMSIISAAVLLFSGERVDWASALPVAAAGIPGAAAGALLLNKLSNRVLQLIFSLLILASGIRILF